MRKVANEYIASLNPKIKIELPKMKKLNNKINCPMDSEDRLLNNMANTSVPSKQPPYRMVIPTPKPKIIPPNRMTMMGFSEITGIGSNK